MLLGLVMVVFFITKQQVMAARPIFTYSPNKHISVALNTSGKLSYTVMYDGVVIVQPSLIDLVLQNNKKLSGNLSVARVTTVYVNDIVTAPVPEKRKYIHDRYNELTLHFKQPFGVQVRVYDDGVAFRIFTNFKDSVEISNELAEFKFLPEEQVLMPVIEAGNGKDRYHASVAGSYMATAIKSIDRSAIGRCPVLVTTSTGIKVGITESDLDAYPGMFLSGSSSGSFISSFPPFPLEEKIAENGSHEWVVTRRADFIAKIRGRRSLPWRVLIIAAADKGLPDNDLVYRLAAPSQVPDITWISTKTGTRDSIPGIHLFKVPVKAGDNTRTYLNYIEAAGKAGFDRLMLGPGWSNSGDLFDINPAINMDSIAAFARQHHIKLCLWVPRSTLDRQLDQALIQLKNWGVDFIITEGIKRDDQKISALNQKIASGCAGQKMFILNPGAFPSRGSSRTWPNQVSGVAEITTGCNSQPGNMEAEYDVTLPFTRMLAGALDYQLCLPDHTKNASFSTENKKEMIQVTTCHQLSKVIIYESPVNLFSWDHLPAKDPGIIPLLKTVPTSWDETLVLEAKLADYIVTARKKGNDWYMGGMTDLSPRAFTIPLDFLEEGIYEATFYADVATTGNISSDYQVSHRTVSHGERLKLIMAPGGGTLIKLIKK